MTSTNISRREWRKVFLYALLIIILTPLCLSAFPVDARQTKSTELLYRSGDRLYLANVTTGTTIALSDIKTTDSDRWLWSPDGRYLLGNLFIKDQGHELRVYDVENQKWLTNFRQRVDFNAAWSSDSTQIAYTTSIKYDSLQQDGQLWVIDLKTATPRLLYQTKITGDRALTDTGVGDIWWSPDNQFLLFEDYVNNFGFGHTDNGLKLISTNSKTVKEMVSPWRGGYQPIWSPDSKWFLLDLPNTLYFPVDSNDAGDVIAYSINYEIYGSSDKSYRLTNTSDVQEQNLSWSSDSKNVQFVVGNQLVSIKLQDVIDNPKAFAQQMTPLPSKAPLGDIEFPSLNRQYIAFLQYKPDSTLDLSVARSDGSEVTPITTVSYTH